MFCMWRKASTRIQCPFKRVLMNPKLSLSLLFTRYEMRCPTLSSVTLLQLTFYQILSLQKQLCSQSFKVTLDWQFLCKQTFLLVFESSLVTGCFLVMVRQKVLSKCRARKGHFQGKRAKLCTGITKKISRYLCGSAFLKVFFMFSISEFVGEIF